MFVVRWNVQPVSDAPWKLLKLSPTRSYQKGLCPCVIYKLTAGVWRQANPCSASFTAVFQDRGL